MKTKFIYLILMLCPLLASGLKDYPVTDEFAGKKHAEEFVTKICIPDKLNEKACSAEYRKAFIYRLREEYPGADVSAIDVWCGAHPVECRNSAALEQQYKDYESSAIAAAQSRQEQQSASIEAEQRSERRRQIFQAIGGGLQSFGDSMSDNRPVRCTSQQIGSRVYTNCNH